MDFKSFQPFDFRAFAADASPETIKKVMTMYTHHSTTPGEKQAAANILKSMGVPLPKVEPVKPKAPPSSGFGFKKPEPKKPEAKKKEEPQKPKSFTYQATWLPHKAMWLVRRSDGKITYISAMFAATKDLALNLASKPGINWQ